MHCVKMTKPFAKYVIAFYSLSWPVLAIGTSNLKFDHIGREQGLTANSVLSIIQDHQGFMWFGTEDGLYRYDGYGMTVYKNDPQDSTSLGNNNVFTLLEDKNNTLWIGTAGGGLNRFDYASFNEFSNNERFK